VLHPGEVGVAARGKAELPARVVAVAEPVEVIEGRIGEDEVGAEIGMEIASEGVGLLLAKLLGDEIKVRSKRNLVQSREFSEMLKKTLNAYHNRTIATQEVIEELIKLAKQLKEADQRGVDLGLNDDEVAFYDALAANNSALEVMGKDNLKVIATELVTQVRKSVTIDWTLRESARAKIKVLVKRVLANTATRPTSKTKQQSSSLHKQSSSAQNGRPDVLVHPKGVAVAFRAAVSDRSRHRTREMLHVSAGSTFPAKRSQFGFAREKR
jgi:hypothetical protein